MSMSHPNHTTHADGLWFNAIMWTWFTAVFTIITVFAVADSLQRGATPVQAGIVALATFGIPQAFLGAIFFRRSNHRTQGNHPSR